jgi:hypothetical protein
LTLRRDVRVVEGARLESVCRGNSTEGSNPSLSANLRQALATLAATVGRPRQASSTRRLSTVARSAKVDPIQPSFAKSLASLHLHLRAVHMLIIAL